MRHRMKSRVRHREIERDCVRKREESETEREKKIKNIWTEEMTEEGGQ